MTPPAGAEKTERSEGFLVPLAGFVMHFLLSSSLGKVDNSIFPENVFPFDPDLYPLLYLGNAFAK
jgi:hypothetical protein